MMTLAILTNLASAKSPNVLIVITDDQGFGEIGVHGNPVVKTPAIDAFAKQSAWLKHFYVSPVCAPTRASLLTGFYNYRTGVVDTAFGRAMMRPDVRTLAQTLSAKGYRTGLFGKWHLGDNYPMRPEDRGFQTTLWHRGGGLAQPADPPGTDRDKAYFNSPLVQNGKETRGKGYCTDAFTDAALEFMAKGDEPFFAYVAFNAPHAPLQVPDDFAEPFRKLNLTEKGFPTVGQPWAKNSNAERIAKAYGMIANIDGNFARLLKALDDRKIADDTIVLFLTDNGPGDNRFNAGLRDRKGSVYDGGIRVPCHLRYPAKFQPVALTIPTMHIDIAPTIDALTGGVQDRTYDGRDLSFRLQNPGAKVKDAARTLFIQWHRGDVPEKNRCFMARNGNLKLVQAGNPAQNAKWTPKYELFDMDKDEYEQHDLAATMPDTVARLRAEYENWFADVTKKGFEPPRIILGNAKENPLRLSRQDWRGDWTPDALGQWHVHVERTGTYRLTFQSQQKFTKWEVKIGNFVEEGSSANVTKESKLEVKIEKGDAVLRPVLSIMEKRFGPDHVTIEWLK